MLEKRLGEKIRLDRAQNKTIITDKLKKFSNKKRTIREKQKEKTKKNRKTKLKIDRYRIYKRNISRQKLCEENIVKEIFI